MIPNTISVDRARRIYDLLGSSYEWAEHFEGRAKGVALDLLELSGGQRVLNVGVGTGVDHARLQAAVSPGGTAIGVDVSLRMLMLTRHRTRSPVCQADGRALPFVSASFDRLFCSYVLDLIPTQDLAGILTEFRRVLKPGGRMALVTLTEGATLTSRVLIATWKLFYAISPAVCAGCRPLHLPGLVREAGFAILSSRVIVQLAVPSEVIVAAF